MLGPLTLPAPGFLEPLIDAVEAGATLAAPTLDGQHGYWEAPDGSLWPRTAESQQPLDVVAFDCLAARREVWEQAPPRGNARDGHYETALSRWATAHGSIVVADTSAVTLLANKPLSVILCTRNRAEEISDAVELLVAHGATAGGGEVIIVDNGSTDETAAIAAELAERHAGVRLIDEEQPGLSYARNAGAAAAINDLLCYLDDDARPGPGWRAHIAWALTRPGVVAAGGPICALWPPERDENWPASGLEQYLSVCERGDADTVLVPPDVAYGANWAIRRSALLAAGGFHPDFGVAPDSSVGGEEVLIAWRLHRSGIGATLYTPLASVGHRIEPDRVCDRWIVERALRGGIEQARLDADNSGQSAPEMLAAAQAAANDLLTQLPLEGQLTLEEACDRVYCLDADLAHRARLAHLLGVLAANVLLLGEHELEIDSLILRLRPEHLRGALERETAGALS
jgi:GT2 family glycosyltransferase